MSPAFRFLATVAKSIEIQPVSRIRLARISSGNGQQAWNSGVCSGRNMTAASVSPETHPAEVLDPVQEALLNEVCILVDEDDKKVGTASKRDCHLLVNGTSRLHRAFSVFLFNEHGELLLQQRSDAKITFPDTYTNTCCSHPLAVPEELDEADVVGVRRAAQRKLQQELGIAPEQVPLDALQYLTRIHYRAPSDETWGEHEIDYILFLQRRVDLKPNPNEVKSVKYVSPDGLRRMLEQDARGELKLTPWFRLICRAQLFDWWENLRSLKKFESHETIHRF
ncbi:Isopentenyl-diphosphate Delta-isomerase 1 [Hypsibius exemplaris]|uniref:isopentenyl-diphosphate Delta-isomerase n=1 Tax=Hypsibius exemplaris TaxID=2072580 RepID=A0A1W0X3E7_HYPEX|nr:Isopentenyl-diphosphate Delta-isomerase 1 [Hypsibius exemplaris]